MSDGKSNYSNSAPRDAFRSKLGFILAAAGSAVGLGNIWKFPYITGTNGGGLFVLIYLGCILLVGLPILVSEIMIGRASQRQAIAAFHRLQGKSSPWAGIGWLGVIAGFVILSFYVVVAGWAMDYTLKSVVNFTKPIAQEAEQKSAAEMASMDMADIRRYVVQKEAPKLAADAERKAREAVPAAARRQHEIAAALAVSTAREEAKKAGHAGDILDPETLLPDSLSSDPAIQKIRSDLKQRFLSSEDDYAKLEELRSFLSVNAPVLNQLAPELERKLTSMFRRVDERRARLMEDPERGAAIATGEALRSQIAQIRHEAFATKDQEVRERDEQLVREAFETGRRRDLIAASVKDTFGGVATDGWLSLFWAGIVMLITILIVAAGVGGGIEAACKTMMPLLFVLVLVMVGYGATTSGFGEAFAFVFSPNAENLKPSGVLEALGHSFFTLSLGMGAMITYGSYQKTKDNVIRQAATIAGLDTFIALLACLMMFPIVFSYGQEPGAGPGLVFQSMPLAFAEIGQGGMLLAVVFFALLVFAALTSSVSMLEVVGSYFKDEKGWSRQRAAWTLGAAAFALSVPAAFHAQSGGVFSSWDKGYGMSFFDTMDYLASNWMLPLGGLFISIYAGWVMPKRLRESEFEGTGKALVLGWLLLIRFAAPALVLLVLAVKIGIVSLD